MTFRDPANYRTYQARVDPVRKEIYPTELNDSLLGQLSETSCRMRGASAAICYDVTEDGPGQAAIDTVGKPLGLVDMVVSDAGAACCRLLGQDRRSIERYASYG